MGFLDGLLKKKEKEEGESPEPKPEVKKGFGNPLDKLKGLLNHLEKIILGLVLVVVATFSVLELINARKDIADLKSLDPQVILGGELLDYSKEQPQHLALLLEKAMEKPDAIDLGGSNHLVFNPRVWKEIMLTNSPEPLLVMDSPREPLGISALKVAAIRTNTALLKARAFIGAGAVRHEFLLMDTNHPVQPYAIQRPNPITTFLPQQPMPPQMCMYQTTGWLPDTNKVRSLHGFQGQQAMWLRYQPDWEFQLLFKAVTQATPAQLAQAQSDPENTIRGLIYNIDLIQGLKEGLYPYQTNAVRLMSNEPYEVVRSFEADFSYETKYHKPPLQLRKFREGRRLIIDGEVFRVFRISSDSVSLVSDPTYGGNGKIYDKSLLRGPN